MRIGKSLLNCFSTIPTWVYLVILGIITFCAQPVFVPSDLTVYSCNALNIYLGKGYVDIDGSFAFFRAPLFSVLIAMGYWIFGVSHVSTFWIIKAFCVLNPLIIYTIGRRFFGKGIGISAALLILTSYSIGYSSHRHLDAIWPFFVLLSTLSLYLGFEEEKSRYFVWGGISLALGYLIKEATILFVPLPLLMFALVDNYRKRSLLTKVSLSYLSTLVVVFPWLFYLFLKHPEPEPKLLLGEGGYSKLPALSGPSELGGLEDFSLALLENLKSLAGGLLSFYHGTSGSVDQWFILAPLFIIAWLYVFLGALGGNKHLRILALHFLLYIPVMYFQGFRNLRVGQSVIIYLLSYLSLSTFADWALRVTSGRIVKTGNLVSMAFPAAIACLLMVQTFISFGSDHGYKEFLLNNQWHEMLFKDSYGAEPYGPLAFVNDDDLLNIIREFSTPPNKLFMAATNRSLAKESYFSLKTGRGSIYYLQSQIMKWAEQREHLRTQEQPVYLTVTRGAGLRPHSLKPVYRLQICKMIDENNITHVLVESYNPETGGNRGLDRYFSTWPAFEKIKMPIDDISIYRVTGKTDSPPTLPPILDLETLGALSALGSEKGEKDISFLKTCFRTLFPSNQIGSMALDTQSLALPSEQTKQEALSLHKRGQVCFDNGAYAEATEALEKAIRLDPDLAEAYSGLFLALAVLERQKAISLAPDNPVVYYHYALLLETLGLFDAAIANVQKAVSLDDTCASVHEELGCLYQRQNRHHLAIDAFRRAVSLYEDFIDPRKNSLISNTVASMGASYLELQDFSKARVYYERAITTAPNPLAHWEFGLLLFRQQDFTAAIDNFKETLSLRPDFSKAHYGLFRSYESLGDRESAMRHYNKLKALDEVLADELKKTSKWTSE